MASDKIKAAFSEVSEVKKGTNLSQQESECIVSGDRGLPAMRWEPKEDEC